jgi:acyl dehydratase
MPAIRFDDLAAFDALVEQGFGPHGKPMEVTQELIDGFADLTGDRQWIHVDVERAKAESPFGGPIAHGFLTLSLLPRLMPRDDGLLVEGHKAAVNYGAESLRFLAPVPAGSSIHARRRVLGAVEKSGGTLVTTEVEVSVVGAEKPSLLYRMQLLYR